MVRPHPPSAICGSVPAAWARYNLCPLVGERGPGRVVPGFGVGGQNPSHFASSTPALLGLGQLSKRLPPWASPRLEQALPSRAQVLAGKVAHHGSTCCLVPGSGSRRRQDRGGFFGQPGCETATWESRVPHVPSEKAVGCTATISIMYF